MKLTKEKLIEMIQEVLNYDDHNQMMKDVERTNRLARYNDERIQRHNQRKAARRYKARKDREEVDRGYAEEQSINSEIQTLKDTQTSIQKSWTLGKSASSLLDRIIREMTELKTWKKAQHLVLVSKKRKSDGLNPFVSDEEIEKAKNVDPPYRFGTSKHSWKKDEKKLRGIASDVVATWADESSGSARKRMQDIIKILKENDLIPFKEKRGMMKKLGSWIQTGQALEETKIRVNIKKRK